MISRLQRAVSLYALLYYAEILASNYIIFAVALPFYPPPLAWLIVVGLTALSHFSLKAARGLLAILALPPALYALGPLGAVVWIALISCSKPPLSFPPASLYWRPRPITSWESPSRSHGTRSGRGFS